MAYIKTLTVKIIDIDADKPIALLHSKTANDLLALTQNRVGIKYKDKTLHYIVDVTDSVVDENTVGIYKDITGVTKLKTGDQVEVSLLPFPQSVQYIIKKIKNKVLAENEIKEIINDIVDNKLSDIEISAFLAAVTINGINLDETTDICKAMTATGNIIEFNVPQVLDKHSIGGINGRVSMIVTPIITSLGYIMPKTASRSISSAAGTADCMEVLADVSFDVKDIKRMVAEVGGMLAWNGKVDLCPADDKMIKIRHGLGLDPEGLVIASVLSKKKSVSATHLIIDVPVGPTVKVRTREDGERWANKFLKISKDIGIKTKVVLTNGEVPCGRYFGAALEAKGAFEVLENKYFDNLAEKACEISGCLLELVGRVEQGKGYDLARETIKSGQALTKFKEIIKIQNGHIFSSEEVPIAKFTEEIKAEESGKIVVMDVSCLTKIARTSGAPHDQQAGIILLKEVGEKVKIGESIFTIHSNSQDKLKIAVDQAKATFSETIKIEKIILEEVN
ncbi:MAG: thymidine phosphorylase [archaeon]|jgi:AMP phosphorylase